MSNELNDSLDDLLGGNVSETPRGPVNAPPSYKPRDFTEVCVKCNGTGSWRGYGRCFACQGKGKKTFKTSSENRAKTRQAAAERKEKLKLTLVEEFNAGNPEVAAWIARNPNFAFAVAMGEAVAKWGSLTEKQLAAAWRCIEAEAARKLAAVARVENAPVIDTAGVDRLKVAFDKAISNAREKGLKLNPKITIGGMVISPAKENSTNPGAIYVKDGDGYLGKIKDGKFYATRECTDDKKSKVLAFVADPKQAAEAYGQTTGVCCICNATLTSKWKLRGIGPICAEKYGW